MTKPRAAALALVGWYLLLPPITSAGRVDTRARLAQWRVDAKFDSSAPCEHIRDALRHVTVLARRAEDPPMEVEVTADHQAVCVSSDDQRLAR